MVSKIDKHANPYNLDMSQVEAPLRILRLVDGENSELSATAVG